VSAFQNFARADRILSRALELPQDEVPSFVAHACGGDDELRVLVENLLAAAGDDEQLLPGGALQGPVWRQVTASRPQDEALRAPSVLPIDG
jgi:hypothetical protein